MKSFDELEKIARLPHGWSSLAKIQVLYSIILATRPDIVCEVGIWSGKSLVPMALACREVGHGVVIGVDPWSRDDSIQGQEGADKKWWNSVNHEEIHGYFVAKLKEYDLANWVDIRRMKSDDYNPPLGIGLVHLDGNHGEQAVRDVERYAANVRVGGFAMLDDCNWTGGTVSKAVERIKELGFVELYRVQGPEQETGMMNDWAIFQRVSK